MIPHFMGSGSTAIAALSLGHQFIGCEIAPAHFEVACKRIEMAWANIQPEPLALFAGEAA